MTATEQESPVAQESKLGLSEESGRKSPCQLNGKISVEENTDWQFFKRVAFSEDIDRARNDEMLKLPPSALKSALRRGFLSRETVNFLVRKNGEPCGYFCCLKMSQGVYEVHTMMLNQCRGRDAITAGRMAVALMFEKPDVRVIGSYCPANIPEAHIFARMVGMKEVGIHPNLWYRNGEGYQVRLVQITREEFLCQSQQSQD